MVFLKKVFLRVNKTKITGEDAFNGNHFGIKDNHESSNDEKTLSWVFLQICDPCFNIKYFLYVNFIAFWW